MESESKRSAFDKHGRPKSTWHARGTIRAPPKPRECFSSPPAPSNCHDRAKYDDVVLHKSRARCTFTDSDVVPSHGTVSQKVSTRELVGLRDQSDDVGDSVN